MGGSLHTLQFFTDRNRTCTRGTRILAVVQRWSHTIQSDVDELRLVAGGAEARSIRLLDDMKRNHLLEIPPADLPHLDLSGGMLSEHGHIKTQRIRWIIVNTR